MGSKRTNLQRLPSSDSSSSSSEEEEQVASPPPAKKPTLNSTSPKTKPPQPPSPDDEEDEDGEPPVSQKKHQKKKKEVTLKKDEKKNEEEEEGSSDEEESSSDEEEEKQQEEEEEDDDESSGTSDDEKKQLSKKPDSMAISASGSDSDSDSEPSEKPAPADIVTPAASGTKRPRDSGPSELENTEKKKLFQRIWRADDEIKILKGIIAFYSDKGLEPLSKAAFGADLDAIHSLLKKSIGLEFSKGQLVTKIRTLKRKFQTNASRCKHNTNPKFSKPQQQEIYELSKKIWRPVDPNEARKSSGKSVKKGKSSALKVLKDQEEVDIPEGDSRYEFILKAVTQSGHGDFSLSLIKRGLKMVDPEKAGHLEKRLQELELARMRHGLQWLDKREEATQLIIDSIAKSG